MRDCYQHCGWFPLLIVTLAMICCANPAGAEDRRNTGWQAIRSAEDVRENWPEKIHELVSALNPDYPGLERVRSALAREDTLEAVEELLEYYRSAATAEWLRDASYEFGGSDDRERAEKVLQDIITRRDVSSEIPKKEHGGWDWTYTGPDQDDEFGYHLNRHRYFIDLLRGWYETGDDAYVEIFDRTIRDWIIHQPLPEKEARFWEVHRTTTQELDWRDIGEVVWRDLDAGIRMGESWPQAFFGFQESDVFSPAARLLMLHSILVHTEYLTHYHQVNHNWTTMEMNGLAFIGFSFPEFEKAGEWTQYAIDVMTEEISRGQVYPDGVQQEITSSTHWVALNRFNMLVETFETVGREVPGEYIQRLEAMYNYIAYSMKPDGHQPLNNDSDQEDVRPRVLRAADRFDRDDWVYIATNGEEGTRPEGLPTVVFPWAGLHIMRNGWEKNSHWGYFKTGPYGIGHQHRDKLHISIHAYGRDLLVDSGRYTHEDYFSFDPTTWRGYFRSSFSQNVVLIDHAGQDVWDRIAKEAHVEGRDYINTDEFDFARGTFTGGYEPVGGGRIAGEAKHTRSVMYVKEKFWVVVDRIDTDRPRSLQTMWRYAPDASVVIENDLQITSDDEGKGNLRIVPAGNVGWDLQVVKGQSEPYYQGWYSSTYGKKEPNPTAVYSAEIDDDTIFAWVLVPSDGKVPVVEADLSDRQGVDVVIRVKDEKPVRVTVPVTDGNPGYHIIHE